VVALASHLAPIAAVSWNCCPPASRWRGRSAATSSSPAAVGTGVVAAAALIIYRADACYIVTVLVVLPSLAWLYRLAQRDIVEEKAEELLE
jgi:hypothetical protein